MPTSQRSEFFQTQVRELATRFHIRKGDKKDVKSSHRIAHLMQILVIKMYDTNLGQDALTCFREWAYNNRIICGKLPEEDDDKFSFFTSSKRFFPQLSFRKYYNILEEILAPPRTPIRKRTPVIRLSDKQKNA